MYEQADTRHLPHDELVQLHGGAAQARVAADLFGQGDDLALASQGRPRSIRIVFGPAIRFCLTVKFLFKLLLRQSTGMLAWPIQRGTLIGAMQATVSASKSAEVVGRRCRPSHKVLIGKKRRGRSGFGRRLAASESVPAL